MKKASGKQTRYRLLVGMLIGMHAMGWAEQGYAEKNMQNEEARRLESSHSALAALSQPGPIVGSTPDSPVSIRLRVYNYAHLDAPLLNRAREVTTAIFKDSGVETAWIDCPLTPADFELYPACQQKTRTTDFVIRIMTASMAAKLPTSDGPLGFAQHCPEDERGCVANVFYSKIDELTCQSGTRAGSILGHAMTHEVGHLLLGANAHSPSGIMRGLWTPDDLRFMSWSRLFFTPQQGEVIRAALRRRNHLEVSADHEPERHYPVAQSTVAR